MKDAVQKSSYLQMRENLSTANKNARTQTYTHIQVCACEYEICKSQYICVCVDTKNTTHTFINKNLSPKQFTRCS